MKLLFKLRDVADIVPWGKPPHRSLHWFGLSDGAYCLQTAAGRLLEYKSAYDDSIGEPWCTYQVDRLYEDLTAMLPFVLEPVPPDVAGRFFEWAPDPNNVPDDDELAEAWFDAQSWWGSRQLDFGYLTACPQLHFWRLGSEVHLRWRTKGDAAGSMLTVQSADAVMPVEAFQQCINSFFKDFLGAMRKRVERIVRDGWTGQDCEIDIAGIVAEQNNRERMAALSFGQPHTDWDAVRRRLVQLGF
jgi:hypothetical protein